MKEYLVKDADGKISVFNTTYDFFNHYKIKCIDYCSDGTNTTKLFEDCLKEFGITFDEFYNNSDDICKHNIDSLIKYGEIICDEGTWEEMVYFEYKIYLVDNKVVSQSEYKDGYYNYAFIELITYLEILHKITIYQRL